MFSFLFQFLDDSNNIILAIFAPIELANFFCICNLHQNEARRGNFR